MKEVEFCPHCNKSLQGEPIPEKSQHLYGGATHFSLKLGVYDEGLDRTVEYACPFCKKQWARN